MLTVVSMENKIINSIRSDLHIDLRRQCVGNDARGLGLLLMTF